VTGPEHLIKGKQLLDQAAEAGEATPAGQALATVASAHLRVAQVIAYVAAELPDRISWQEAKDA
jgi:hypothetical protein